MITQGFQAFQVIKNNPGNIKQGKGSFSNVEAGEGNSFNSIFGRLMNQEKTGAGAANPGKFFDIKSIVGSKENLLIDKLLANINPGDRLPKDLSVDSSGLKLLEKLLAGLGFSKESISSFMSELTENGAKKGVSLQNMLTKLNSFLKSGESHDELDMSSLPFIESILSGLGVEPKDIKTALNNTGDYESLDIQSLIDNLKKIATGMDKSQTGVVSENRQLLAGLGIAGEKGAVSLEDFIGKLEALVDSKSGKKLSGDVTDDIAKSLGKNIENGGKNQDALKVTQGRNNAFLNNPSFQKQQQMAEENLNLDQLRTKKGMEMKSVEPRFLIKGEADIINGKKLSGAVAKTQDDSGQGFKLGVTDLTGNNSGINNGKLSVEKTLPSYVTNQVGRQIGQAVKNGQSEISFQIKPPEMGRLQINIEFTKSGMKVGILAEHSATRDMLLSNSGDLKTVLADQGIKLEKVQVDVSGNFNQSMADARRESENSRERRNSQNDNDNSYEQVVVNETTRMADDIRMETGIGRLNLVV